MTKFRPVWWLVAAVVVGALTPVGASADNPQPSSAVPVAPIPRMQTPSAAAWVRNQQTRAGPIKVVKPPVLSVSRKSFPPSGEAPVGYTPFPVVDPGTNRPVAPETMVKLPRGRNANRAVTAKQFNDSVNRLEKYLNSQGHSLRQKSFNMAPAISPALLSTQRDLAMRRVKLLSPAEVQQRNSMLSNLPTIQGAEQISPSQPKVALKRIMPLASALASSRGTSAVGPGPVAITPGSNPDYPTIQCKTEASCLVICAGMAAAYRDAQRNGIAGADPCNVSCYNPISMPEARRAYCDTNKPDTLTTPVAVPPQEYSSGWFGDPDWFAAQFAAHFDITGAKTGISSHASASANASVLGQTFEIVGAHATMDSPTGQLPGNRLYLDLDVLGQSVWSLDQPAQQVVSDHQHQGTTWGSSIQLWAGPIPVTVGFSVGIEAALDYSVLLSPGLADVAVGPSLDSQVTISAGVGGDVDLLFCSIGASAGVEGQLTLLRDALTINATASISPSLKGFTYQVSGINSLTALDGSIGVSFDVDYCFDSAHWYYPFVNTGSAVHLADAQVFGVSGSTL